MAILYVIGNELLSPIVESQVFRPLAAEAQDGEAFLLALLPAGLWLRPRHRSRVREAIARLSRDYGVTIFTSYSRLSHCASKWIDTLAVRRVIRKLVKSSGPLDVRGRNSYAAATALAAARGLSRPLNVTYDCRGDEVAELLGKHGVHGEVSTVPSHLAPALRRVTANMAHACKANAIITVSKAMGRLLHDRFGVPLNKITVRPCAVDMSVFPSPDSERARASLGLADRFVVCYLGSLEWYQLPDQSVRLFKLFQKLAKNAFFLAVTTDPDAMARLLASAEVSPQDFQAVKAAPREVAGYVSAAHVGFLLRENSPVNLVASPVKFAEYLACGVPVLITKHVGDYSGLVEPESLGFQVDLEESDAEISLKLMAAVNAVRQDQAMSRHCRKYAEKHLAWRLPAVRKAGITDPNKADESDGLLGS